MSEHSTPAEGLTQPERAAIASAVHDEPGHKCQCGPVYATVERILVDRLAAAQAEVKHWKDHAEEAGRGFERVCLDAARMGAARRSAEAERDAAQAEVEALRERVQALYGGEPGGDGVLGRGGVSECDRDECFCCGKGHWCEPERYPEALGDSWTCPECGRLHHAYDPHDDNLPDWIAAKIPAGVLGWRSTATTTRYDVTMEGK